MAPRDQRHAKPRARRLLRWLPDVVVVLVVAVALAQMQFDLGHRWLGLDRTDPATQPGQVAAPRGLDLDAGADAPLVGDALVPGAVDPTAARKALAPFLSDPKLGPHLAVQVADLSTGELVVNRGKGAFTPASTMKILTSAAALTALGPGTRFSTRVLGAGKRIVLVGGGDPFLASTPAAATGEYPVRATLTGLANRTAATLRKAGTTRVTLGYDTSLFTGPAVNPRWPATYVPENVVSPVTSLWVDEALDSNGFYVADPARTAATVFVAQLKAAGITVVGQPTERKAPAGATEIAVVRSAPVGEIVQQTLAVSDNLAAEVLARHVGATISGDASFVGGTKAIFEVLQGLGVDMTGSVAYDGSGLSRETKLTATSLIGTLEAAVSADHPLLREAITGLPVAGFTGSLKKRFDRAPDAARGRVLAKTGTLTGVHGLAGVAADLDGNLMAFVFVADRVGTFDGLAAQHALDLMAGSLGACRCGG